MANINGLAAPGTSQGLDCLKCGGECANPLEHLTTDRNSSGLLLLDDRCRLYAEVNRHGRRMRLMRVYRNGGVSTFLDDMGPEADFKAGPFIIPSVGDDPHDWNTVGECFDIAGDAHSDGGFKTEGRAERATGKAWAEEYVNQQELMRQELAARSTYGAGGHFQRDRDWRK